MNETRQGVALILAGIALLALFSGVTAALAPPIHQAEQTRVDGPTLVGAMGNGHDGGVYELNESGDIVWSFEKDAISYNDVSRMGDDRVLAAFQEKSENCGRFETPCFRTGYRIINTTTNEIVDEWDFPVRTAMNSEVHDVEYLPQRGEVLIADMDRERVFALNLSSKTITWQWNASQRYEAPPEPTRTDWLHINDVDAIDDGRYLISVRNTDQLLILNRSCACASEVINRKRSHQLLKEQHNPQWLGDDAVLVADSENDRVVELHQQPNGSWTVAWSAISANGIQFDWPRDADRLPNGNTLVLDTRNNRVVEITKAGDVVWSASIPEQGYDAERGGTEYPVGPAYNASGMVVGTESRPPVPGLNKLYGGVRHFVPLPYWVSEWHLLVGLISVTFAVAGSWLIVTPRLEPLVERWRDWQTPDTVKRASRRERWKRQAWMIGSSIVAAFLVVLVFIGIENLGFPGELGVFVIAWMLLDQRLFSWGVEYFDLVLPWQFREEVEDGE